MRDILDKIQMLVESTGLAGRKPGDVFRNSAGEEIVFSEIKFFPEEGGKYSPEELSSALKQASRKRNIVWQNAMSPRTGGFAIAKFASPEGDLYFGTYLQNIKPNTTDNYVANTVVIKEWKGEGLSFEQIFRGQKEEEAGGLAFARPDRRGGADRGCRCRRGAGPCRRPAGPGGVHARSGRASRRNGPRAARGSGGRWFPPRRR